MRHQQRARTRDAIVRAAGEVLRAGAVPDIAQIAEIARVSRATAYRYFASLEALLDEASSRMALSDAEPPAYPSTDPFERLELLDDALDRGCRDTEGTLRRALARSIGRGAPRADPRTDLIEQALAPLGPRLGKARLERLAQALTMVIGTEAFIALGDVAGLDEAQAREVRRWAIDAMVAAALSEAYSAG